MHKGAIADEVGMKRWRTVTIALVVVLVCASCSADRGVAEDVVQNRTVGTFNSIPVPLPPGPPGSLVRSERLLGAPNGSIAWRVLYRSTDVHGAPIAVSGIVVAPDGPAPKDGRPVVSWGHPTTGAYGHCAPSEGLDPFALIEGVHELLDAGYVIAATDYPGMGADGPPSYLIGDSEGNSVLDAARAARAIPETHAGPRLVLWGHSQGGQAALFAAQSARSYAPELDLEAVAVAAPAVELGDLLVDHRDDVSGVTIGAYAFDSYERVYGATDPSVQLGTVLTPAGQEALPQMTPLCLLTHVKELHDIADPLVGKFFASDPTTTEPWASLLEANTPGGAPIGVPLLVTQGNSDELVKPSSTTQYVQGLCAANEHVEYRTYDHITHGLIAERTIPLLVPWLAEVAGGHPPASTCASK